MSQNLDEECWEYLDQRELRQGPFSSRKMMAWHGAGMLPNALRVRHTSAMPFTPIKELFPTGVPFGTRPMPKAAEIAGPCTCQWQYMDNKGVLQGPFSSAQMKLWFGHGMLPPDLRVRRVGDYDFSMIASYFPAPRVAFQSQPVEPVSARPPKPMMAAAPMPPQKPQAQALVRPVANDKHIEANGKAHTNGKAARQNGKGAHDKNGHEVNGGRGKGARNGAAEHENGGGKNGTGGRGKKNEYKEAGWSWDEQGWAANGDDWWESAWWENGWNEGWDEGYTDAAWKEGGDENPKPKEKEKGVQAVLGHLNWGPKCELPDLLPEALERKVLDEGIVWEERWISPFAVRFSQGKIHPFFHERGPIYEVLAQIRHRNDHNGVGGNPIIRIEPPFPPIRLLHLKQQGVLVTLDNRRLYALQKFALQEWPNICLVRALSVEELTPTRLKAENRKFTNRLCGLQLEMESRSNAFETFSWVTEAAHAESARFCRPAMLRAVDKEMSLLPVLVVHSLISPKKRALLQSRWPVIDYCARILPNPAKRNFASKRVLLHHVMELARCRRSASHSPAVCVAFKSETVVTLSKGKGVVKSKLSLVKPLELLKTQALVSCLQRKVVRALIPFFCIPYAQHALKGETQRWVIAFLVAWGKLALHSLQLPECA
eukprot:TRINITY_DN7324_c0_g3_i1.p1 TRINITY_DN7324_c0_g3~~TRINITY_DN7324_c0_g3_i1.p1  ORF type:complete len:656 (+),score=140.32 TRINITY_DN7324_c0_g3_i1:76-2043(+)